MKAAFEPNIAEIVREVTGDKQLAKQRRKEPPVEHAADISKSAKLAIDKVQGTKANPESRLNTSYRKRSKSHR